MFSCNDPFITYLKAFGYNVIRLPKADIGPLQILARNGKDLDPLGDISTILVAGADAPLPPVTRNTRTANISGQRTSDLSIGVGLSILGGVIGAMGGSKLGLDAMYKNARTAAFEFQDVYEDKVEVARLDQHLADADVNPFSRYVAKLLEADEIFVTTSTIKSTKFIVEAKKSDGGTLDVSIPEIQEVVGGSVKVSGSAAMTSKVAYESSTPLVFGFQAVRLYYDQGRYTAFEPVGAGSVAMKAIGGAPPEGVQRLTTESAFVRLANL